MRENARDQGMLGEQSVIDTSGGCPLTVTNPLSFGNSHFPACEALGLHCPGKLVGTGTETGYCYLD